MIETKTLKQSSTNSDVKNGGEFHFGLLETQYATAAISALCPLSQKNNWIDTQGHIYVIYPLSHLAKDLGCCISSVTRSFSELENAQLAERVRSGFSKPSRILLKVPYTTQNCAVTVCKNAEHDCAETSSVIAQKCTPNQRNKSNLNDNHLIRSNNARLSLGECTMHIAMWSSGRPCVQRT